MLQKAFQVIEEINKADKIIQGFISFLKIEGKAME